MKKFLISCLESRVESSGVLYGRYLFGPLPRGQGVTIATALRRSLLAEVSGLAATSVEIVGVAHEYAIIPGTRESVLDLILNLKKLIFTSTTPMRTKAIGYISVQGPGKITGRDLRLPPGLQCINPDEILATAAADGFVNLKVVISSGKNYLVQSGVNLDGPKPAVISDGSVMPRKIFPIDAVFMPVIRVNSVIQSDEDVLHFPLHIQSRDISERVVFEIWTNGTLTPREALAQASSELIRLFSLFQIRPQPSILLQRPNTSFIFTPENSAETPHTLQQMYIPNEFLEIDVGILPLTPAILVAFKEREIHRLGDLLGYSDDALLQIPGMTSDILFNVLCYLRTYGIQLQAANNQSVVGRA
jgi:DNA-directed RNA polymerase subunit alpha